jgi:hypothetical protein
MDSRHNIASLVCVLERSAVLTMEAPPWLAPSVDDRAPAEGSTAAGVEGSSDCLLLKSAQLALIRNDAPKAMEAIQGRCSCELGTAAGLDSVYVRGQAYLAAHEGNKAAGEFQEKRST